MALSDFIGIISVLLLVAFVVTTVTLSFMWELDAKKKKAAESA